MSIVALASPPQPSYAPADLLSFVADAYWPSLVVATLLTLLPAPRSRGQRSPPPLASTLPFLAWALQSHRQLQLEFWFGAEAYVLWHGLIVSLLALAAVIAILAIHFAVARCVRPAPTSWPNPIWCAAVVAAPVADWVVMVFFCSPLEAVLKQ